MEPEVIQLDGRPIGPVSASPGLLLLLWNGDGLPAGFTLPPALLPPGNEVLRPSLYLGCDVGLVDELGVCQR